MEEINIDSWTLIATIFLAIIGWLVSLWLQRKNLKDQHRTQIQYDIYKQLVQARKELQEPLNDLGASVVTPFILMDSSMIPFTLKLKKQYKNSWFEYSESECLLDGEQKWNKYVNGIKDSVSKFINKYIIFISIFEDWEAALSKLINTKNILAYEIQKLKKSIDSHADYFQTISSEKGHDWRNWDRKDLEMRTNDIRDCAFTIGSYINDFMVLAHNELMAKYFNHKRSMRITLDPKYKVLVKDMLIENVDHKKVAEMKINKDKVISYAQALLDRSLPPKGTIDPDYEKFLRSVISGFCPTCNNPIEVYSFEESDNSFCFNYLCGHSWKGITIEETISVSELIKTKTARPGFGWLRKTTQGHKQSGDPKLKKGVEVYMDVNREKNEYHQIVTDNETKEVLHEEHEPLTEHRPKNNNPQKQ